MRVTVTNVGSADELPIYESRRTPLGLWQRYLVYRDRIELRTLFGLKRLSFGDIEEISVAPSLLKGIMSKDLSKSGDLRALKADFADFTEHVVVRTRKGVIRTYRFTPEQPQEFVYSALAAMRRYPQMALRQQSYNQSAANDTLNARS